jgi:lysophospholipase L1-like esterase
MRSESELPVLTTTMIRALAATRRAAAAGLLLSIALLLAVPAGAAPPRRYYVSLGDSLAVGAQPAPDGHDVPTSQGYADAVARRLGASVPELRLAKLGCPGETTTTMLDQQPCAYGTGSQLAESEAFLAAHRGAVSLITINIGDNDIEGCFRKGGALDRACLSAGLAAVRANLPAIVARLRAAAGPRVPIVGVTDYDQFLAYWLRGAAGRRTARASIPVIARLNRTIDTIYGAGGVIVADAGAAFATADFAHAQQLAGHGRVPHDVAVICRLTWACSQPPVGMNDHANASGYRLLATVIESALDRARPRLL